MSDAAWLWLASLSGFVGMSGLALAMKPHWQQVFNSPLTSARQRGLRMLGVLALALAAFFCAKADHPSMAVLVWIMLLALAALAVAVLLNRKPAVFRGGLPFKR